MAEEQCVLVVDDAAPVSMLAELLGGYHSRWVRPLDHRLSNGWASS
ncbi:hypothetical protein [Arthrobacter glacialis]|nr:hypothetical protein [Arthrobacter glacialis]